MYCKMNLSIHAPSRQIMHAKRKVPVLFEEVPKKVGPREEPAYSQKIPFILLQTFRDNKVGPKVKRSIENLLHYNPEYRYLLVTDEDADKLLATEFPPAVHLALRCLQAGAAKGDLIRYCLLFLYGGVYLDMDSSFGVPLRELIDPDSDLYIGLEPDGASPVNWAMMFTPRHPLVRRVLRECVRRVLKREYTHIFDATGPNLYSDVLVHYLSGKTLKRTRSTLNERRQIVAGGISGGKFVPTQGEHPWRYTFRGYSEDQLYTEETKRYCARSKVTYRLYWEREGLDDGETAKLMVEFDRMV